MPTLFLLGRLITHFQIITLLVQLLHMHPMRLIFPLYFQYCGGVYKMKRSFVIYKCYVNVFIILHGFLYYLIDGKNGINV